MKILKFKLLIITFLNHIFTCNWASVVCIKQRMILDWTSAAIKSLVEAKQSNGSRSFLLHAVVYYSLLVQQHIFWGTLVFFLYTWLPYHTIYICLEVSGAIRLTNSLLMNWKSAWLLSQLIWYKYLSPLTLQVSYHCFLSCSCICSDFFDNPSKCNLCVKLW